MDDLEQLLAESTKAYKHKATEVLLTQKEIAHILVLTLVQEMRRPVKDIQEFVKLRSSAQRDALIANFKQQFDAQKAVYIAQTYTKKPSAELLELMDKMRDGQDWKPVSMVEVYTEYHCTSCASVSTVFNGYYQILQHKMKPDRRQLVRMRKADAHINELKFYVLEGKVEKCIECSSVPRNSDELAEYESLLKGVLPL